MSRLDIEELTKTALALILVLCTFVFAFYQYPAPPPRPNLDQATRLVILPPRPFHLNKQENMTLFVVDGDDIVNRSRNDAVELRLSEKSNASLGVRTPSGAIWSKHISIRLQNGTVEFILLGRSPEFVTISANCIEKDPPTMALMSSLAIGGGLNLTHE